MDSTNSLAAFSMRFLGILLLSQAIGLSLSAQERPLIVLDAGHTPSAPGSIGACGKREVDLNDDAVKALQKTLELSGGYQVKLTRPYQKEVLSEIVAQSSKEAAREPRESLLKRGEIANQAGARFFISIHHDSTEEKNQIKDPNGCGGIGGMKLTDEFKNAHKIGFNVFVYQGDESNKERFEESKRLATILGKKLRDLGLTASDYHQKPFEDCNSCRALDADKGVWNQDLAILKTTKMPAILIEAQTIADPEQEKIASSDAFREKLARAIKESLDELQTKTPAWGSKKKTGAK